MGDPGQKRKKCPENCVEIHVAGWVTGKGAGGHGLPESRGDLAGRRPAGAESESGPPQCGHSAGPWVFDVEQEACPAGTGKQLPVSQEGLRSSALDQFSWCRRDWDPGVQLGGPLEKIGNGFSKQCIV